jgi:hypothetical protein
MKNRMSSRAATRYFAIAEMVLIFPAVLFMSALFVQNLQPPPFEPAQTARRVIAWFSLRPLLGLDVFLIGLPFAVFVAGLLTVLRRWAGDSGFRDAVQEMAGVVRTYLAPLLVAGATLTAGSVLFVVALHMITE